MPANEVKNRIPLAFDIPPRLAKKLIDYRNRLAPKVIGRRPDRLFVKADGTAKNQWAVAWLVRTYLRKRAGLQLSPHQFRHSIAKFLLDAAPGDFETVRQLLGHASLQTTVVAYTGTVPGAPRDITNASSKKPSLSRRRSVDDEAAGRIKCDRKNQ